MTVESFTRRDTIIAKITLDEKNARLAAKWWADRLRQGAKLDHGPKSMTDMFAIGMGATLQKNAAKGRTEEQVQKFEDALCEELKTHKILGSQYIVGVDYHPQPIFERAAEKAGIKFSGGCLPWKTHMYLIDGEIQVSYGYGAPMKKI